MREGIHPKYHEVEARCACGNRFKTKSTKPELHLEICAACHPFFTGKQKLIDTQGRIDRFKRKYANAPARPVKPKKEAARKAATAKKSEKSEKPKKAKKESAAKA